MVGFAKVVELSSWVGAIKDGSDSCTAEVGLPIA